MFLWMHSRDDDYFSLEVKVSSAAVCLLENERFALNDILKESEK